MNKKPKTTEWKKKHSEAMKAYWGRKRNKTERHIGIFQRIAMMFKREW